MALFKRKKNSKIFGDRRTNWEKLQDRTPEEVQRDVYNTQQLDRSEIGEMKSPLSRTIFSVVISILIFVVLYLSITFVRFGVDYAIYKSKQDMSVDYGKQNITEITENDYIASDFEFSSGGAKQFYYPIPSEGFVYTNPTKDVPSEDRYESADLVPKPDWAVAKEEELKKNEADKSVKKEDEEDEKGKPVIKWFSIWRLLGSLAVSGILFSIIYSALMRNLRVQNQMNDTSDINQHVDDQHIALPEEIQRKFDYFPDAGAHSNVSLSSMISHMAISNKGIKPIMMAERYKEDVLDEDGEVLHYKGEAIVDENGNHFYKKVSMIDEKFSDALFDASGADKIYWKKWNVTDIPYNPGGEDRDKLGSYDTVADLINDDWVFPDYEVQRPGGVYLVDTAPVNTMVF